MIPREPTFFGSPNQTCDLLSLSKTSSLRGFSWRHPRIPFPVGGFVTGDITVEGRTRDLEGRTYIGNAVIFIVIKGKCQGDFLFITERCDTRMAATSSTRPSSSESCLRSFTNEITLKLSQGTK